MATEDPYITEFTERQAGRNVGQYICRIIGGLGRVLEGGDAQIDLAHLEAGVFDVEIKPNQREVLKLLREQSVVPGRDLGEPVVGDHERASLGWGKMIQAQTSVPQLCRAGGMRATSRARR